MALLYKEQKNWSESLQLYQRALKIDETALGPDHPQTLLCENNLAELYEVQGNYSEGLPLFERTAEGTMRQLELTSAVQSERQQLSNIRKSRWFLDSFISCALLAGDKASAAYEQMLTWKGSVLFRQR